LTQNNLTGQSSFVYDALNRFTELTLPSFQTATFAYDALSRRIGRSLPNGVDTDLTFDDAGRLLDIGHTAGATNLSSFAYGYDSVSNRTAMTQATRPKKGDATLSPKKGSVPFP